MKELRRKNSKKIKFSLLNTLLLFMILAVSIGGSLLPMLSIIGYESSVLAGIMLSIVGGLSTVNFLNTRGGAYSTKDLRSKTWLYFLALILITTAVPIASTKLLGNCPSLEGVLFHLVISIPSLLIGISIGAFWYKTTEGFHYINTMLSLIIILLLPAVELFFNPQIYFYNPIIGIFPGTIYDEDIQIDLLLIIYRVANLLYFRIVLFCAFMLPSRGFKIKLATRGALILIPVIFAFMKPEYELATNKNRLEKELTGKALTENFRILFPNDLSKKNINNLVLHHEYFYSIIPRIGLVQMPDKIESFIFKNREQKRKLFGAGRADVAKPWLFQLYTQADSYGGSLKHEIIHVFSAEHGITPLKLADNFNPALIEGYAMALENNYDDYDPHYLAKLAKSAEYEVNINRLFSGFNFFEQASSISYIYSGSFLKYLKDEYGIQKLYLLYGDLDFEKHYGKEIEFLSSDYNSFLSSLKYTANKATADLYFGYKPIFKKVCVRQRANDLIKAWELYSEEKITEATAEFKRIYNYSDSYPALLGYIQSLEKSFFTVEAQNFLVSEIENFNNTSYYYNLQLLLGDLYIKNKTFAEAKSIFNDVSKQKPNDRYYTQALFKLYLLRRGNDFAYNYVIGEMEEKYEILLQINKGNLVYESIPSLITFGKLLDKDSAVIKKILETKLRVEGALSSYCAFYSSKYFVETNDYKLARKFAQSSLKFCPKQSLEVRKAQVDKIEWFIKFGDSILENMLITN